MESRHGLLGAFLGLHTIVALASPQGFAPGFVPARPSYLNTTTQLQPTKTEAACDSKCSVLYPQISAVLWVPEAQVVYTTTYTVATVYVQVSATYNSLGVQTVTVFNDPLPTDYNFWVINSDSEGTSRLTFPVTKSEGIDYSQIQYPTPWLDYEWEYHWQGVLQTHNKEDTPVCATAAPPDLANVPLGKAHPEYPQLKGPIDPGRSDPFGHGFVPVYAPWKVEPDEVFFQVAFPSESAFSYCESMSHTDPLPTDYTTVKYVTVTTTQYGNFSGNFTLTPNVPAPFSSSFSQGIGIQPTATGWETTTKDDGGGVAKTATGFETTPPFGGKGRTSSQAIVRVESTATGLGDGQARQTNAPEPGTSAKSPGIPNIIASIIKNNPGFFSPSNPTPAPGQFAVAPTPTFTFVPTVINGQSTSIPAFLLPSSGGTATIGQSVTINGQTTVLTAPSAIFTSVSTTINGVPTVVPAYIISGTSTATLGQTIVLNGQTTVLAASTLAPASAKTSGADSVTSSAPQGSATATKAGKGAATTVQIVSWNAFLIAIGAAVLVLL